jgi:hypothetical protein
MGAHPFGEASERQLNSVQKECRRAAWNGAAKDLTVSSLKSAGGHTPILRLIR